MSTRVSDMPRSVATWLAASALLAGLLTGVGATRSAASPALSEPAPVATRGAIAKAPKRTKLVLRFSDCAGCTLTLRGRYRDGDFRWRKTVRVRPAGDQHQAVVRTARANTRGLVIEVSHPRSVHLGAATLAVMRYADLAPGQVVPDPHYTDGAHPCWAGTKKKRVLFDFAMAGAHAESLTGEEGMYFMPFLVRGKKTIGPAVPTDYRVGASTQEFFGLCGS